MHRSIAAVAGTVFLLAAGCATAPPAPPPDTVHAQIAASAERISNQWAVISAIELKRNPAAAAAAFRGRYPTSLEKRTTMRFSGPIEPLVKLLAAEAGGSFDAIGVAPATAIPISIDVREKRIGDVLREVGLQAGSRAVVAISEGVAGDNVTVELRYAAAN